MTRSRPRKSENTARPIRNERDHGAALAEIEKLWDARPGTPEHGRLDVPASLVDAWERQHHPIGPPDPVEAIRFRMEQRGLSRKDLEKFIGGRGRVAEVLSGKRRLTLAMIRRLHTGLGVPADVLIRQA